MDDDPWIVAKVLLTDRERIAAAILILSLEEDGDFISANSGPASDGESPLASRRQPVIAEGVRIALDTVRLAQRDLLDAAPAFVRHRHRKVGRVDAVMTRIKIQGPARGSEERRVGKRGGSTCRSRWSPGHKKKK